MSFFRRCFNLPLHTSTHKKKKIQRQEQLVENVEGAQIRAGHWKRRWQEEFCASRKNGFGSTLKKRKKSFYYFRCRLAGSKNGELLYKCWFCPFQETSSLFRSDGSVHSARFLQILGRGGGPPRHCWGLRCVPGPHLLSLLVPALDWIVHSHIHAKVLILDTSHVTLFKNRLLYVQLVKTDLVVRVGFGTRLVAQSSA